MIYDRQRTEQGGERDRQNTVATFGKATATQRRREAADGGGIDHADRCKHTDARAAQDGDKGAMQEQRQRRGGFCAAGLIVRR